MTVATPRALPRQIRSAGATFLALNGMIGAGIFALPATVAASAGMFGPWLFLIAGVLFVSVILTFAELSSYFNESGGPVLYATTAFGPVAGFNTGWILFISRLTAFAANTNVIVLYAAPLWPWVGDGIGRILLVSGIIGGLTFANYIGVKDGMRTVGILTLLKLTPLLAMILLGLSYVDAGALFTAPLPEIAGLGDVTLLLFYAYFGFEAATITAGETANPKRALPRALIITVISSAVLYFFIELVFIAVLPDGAATKATLADVGGALIGPAGAIIITFTAIFSVSGNLASAMVTAPRLTYALAEEKLLPAWFGNVHARYMTPDKSILFFGVLAIILAVTGSFVWLAAASSLARLASYIICIAALPVIRRKADAETRAQAMRVRWPYLVAAIAMALCIFVTTEASAQAWGLAAALVAVGMLLYWLEQYQARKKTGT